MRNLAGTRTWSPGQLLFGCEVKQITVPRVRTIERTRGELDDGKRSKRGLQSPRFQRTPRANDAAAAVDKRDVDRESHEKSVDAAAGREDQGAVGGEADLPSRPRLRLRDSNAVSMSRATTLW